MTRPDAPPEPVTPTPPARLAMMQGDEAEAAAKTLKALADPARLQIVTILGGADQRGVCVCDLIPPLGLTQSTVSHHLKVLATAGLVERRKQGTWVYYSLNRAALNDLLSTLPL
jgi:ArsR family transcriptional regulator